MARMVDFYNAEVERYAAAARPRDVTSFINTDARAISWSDALKQRLAKGRAIEFGAENIIRGLYRPFHKQWLYYERNLNERVYRMPQIFPTATAQNRVIQVSGVGARSGFSALMTDHPPCLDTIEKGQCFPLYLYEQADPDASLFAARNANGTSLNRLDAITDEGLADFQASYPGEPISKEDLFAYIYGLLHAPDYRERFANNLAKGLPRIPAVKSLDDFSAFRDAGRALGDLHVNFERAEPCMVSFKEGDHCLMPEAEADPEAFYRVTRMKFGCKGGKQDRSIIIYNDRITLEAIPLEAYDYVVNGKPALEWVMERQGAAGQCQRHRQRCQRLRHRDRRRSEISTRPGPADHNRQPQDHEDRQSAAETGYRLTATGTKENGRRGFLRNACRVIVGATGSGV